MQNCRILFTNSHTIPWITNKQILLTLHYWWYLDLWYEMCHWFELSGQILTFHIAENICRTFKCASQSVVLICKLSHVQIWICSMEYSEHVVIDIVSVYVKHERVMYVQLMAHNSHSAIIPEPFSDCMEGCNIWYILEYIFFVFRLSICLHCEGVNFYQTAL
jgi:hypothetical protein